MTKKSISAILLQRVAPACVFLILVSVGIPALAQNYSLVIGVDGLASYGIQAVDTPNIDSLINGTFGGGSYQGAFAQHAYAGGIVGTPTQQVTGSGPGWGSIHTGVWVDKNKIPGDNTFGGADFVNNPIYMKTLSDSLGAANVYTGSAVSWVPINTGIVSSFGGMNYVSSPNNDTGATNNTASQIAGAASGNFAFFMQLDDPDNAGHAAGEKSLYSNGYRNAVANSDSRIGTMLSAITSRTNFENENWQVIVTSDHGHNASFNVDPNTGIGENGHRGHGAHTMMERTIPFIISSKNATQGFVPSDSYLPSQVDVAPTVLSHFGVAKPANYVGQSVGSGPSIGGSTLSLTGAGSGLVSHMAFDGNVNESLAGNGGTIRGSVGFTAGKFGQAITVAEYGKGSVLLDDDLGAQFGTNTDFGISMWVKYDSVTGDPSFFSNKDWESGQNTGINLAVNDNSGDGNNVLYMNTKGSSGTRGDVFAPEAFNSGEWQNVILNVDRDGRAAVYVDGILIGARDSTTLGSLDGAFNWALLNDGTGNYGLDNSGRDLSGLAIDEFAAWNRLLTNDEISILSRSNLVSSVPEPGAIALLAFSGMIGLLRRRRES